MADPVLLVDKFGEVQQVPAEQAAAALASGYLPPSPQQASDYAAQLKYGTGTEAAKAFAEHAASALTLGLSDVAERGMGVDPAAMVGRERANPVASMAGTAAGVAAPLVATLGGSALADVAEATAPSLIARAGKAASGAVKAALPEAEGLAGKIAAKAIASGAGSAVEGAAYGAGQVVHEAALGDPALTAESALATVGFSAALGGGLGAGFGAGEALLPAAVDRAKNAIGSVYRSAEGKLGDFFQSGAGAKTTGVLGDTATLMLEHKQEISGFEALSPGVSQDIASASPQTAQFLLDHQQQIAAAEKGFPGITKLLANASPETGDFILTNWDKIIRDPGERIKLATRQASSTQEAYGAIESALRTANREIRPAEIESLLPGGPAARPVVRALTDEEQAIVAQGGSLPTPAAAAPSGALEEARRLAGKLDTAAAEMRAKPDLYPSMYAGKLEQIRDGLMRDAADGAPAKVFNAINDAKQSLDPLAKFGKLTGPEHRDATSLIKGLRGQVKASLEDAGVWGEAAARQEAFNAAQNEYFTAREEFRKTFTRKTTLKTGAVEYQVDPVKVNMWFNAMADARGQARTQIHDRFLEASRDMLEQIEKSHAAAPVAGFERAGVESLVNKSAEITADARQRASVTELVKQLQPGTQILGSGPAVPAAAMGALGMVAPGIVTSTVKATMNAAGAITNVPRAVATLAKLERMGQAIANKIDAGVAAIVNGGSRAKSIGRSEVAAGIASAFGRDTEAARALYLRRTSQIRSLADPSVLQGKLATQTDDLHEHAPNTAQALQIASARGVAFLASKLPQAGPAGALSPKPVPSRAEIAKFTRYYEAVEHPASILKQAAAGTLTPEALEAVQTVYPQLFAKIQTAAAEKIGAAKGTVPYRSRMMLASLVGHDLDGSLSARSLLANRAAFARIAAAPRPQPQGGDAGAKSITLASRFQTPDQRSAQRSPK